jgi:hypothetical protein
MGRGCELAGLVQLWVDSVDVWPDIGHTPSSVALHPRRLGYVRDSVARTLTPGSPAVRAIVSESFALDD